ncbi:hypothetical protein IV37_GL001089 [Fructilactobacillus fructivorans]|nr:hypothetical protein IV37_GL001089 [Fructilactobacillus fructivorans]
MSNKETLAKEQAAYSKAARIKYFNIVIKSGSGAILTDEDNHTYIDLLSSASSTNTGHCHPHVVKAIRPFKLKLVS